MDKKMNHSLIPFYLILSHQVYFNDKRYRLITSKSVVHSLPEINVMYGPGQILYHRGIDRIGRRFDHHLLVAQLT
jgi:hypothetical protein